MSLPPPPGEDANGRRYSISTDGSLSVDSQPLSPPLRVSSLPSCGTSHCMALSRAGEVFSWATGRDSNRFGQLGWGTTASDVDLYSPRRVELPRGASATAVAAGACHSAVIDEDKRLWIFGSDRWLQLGQDKSHGSLEAFPRPQQLAAEGQPSSLRGLSASVWFVDFKLSPHTATVASTVGGRSCSRLHYPTYSKEQGSKQKSASSVGG